MTLTSRRDFLKLLGVVALSPLIRASPEVRFQARKVYLITVYIVGTYYYEGLIEEVVDKLSIGEELELCREPDNHHDANAIEVYTLDGRKLGYVPHVSNPIPASIADQDVAIGAEVFAVDRGRRRFSTIRMRLYMLIPN